MRILVIFNQQTYFDSFINSNSIPTTGINNLYEFQLWLKCLYNSRFKCWICMNLTDFG